MVGSFRLPPARILLVAYYTHSLYIFRVSDWLHSLHSAYRIDPVLPPHTLQLLYSWYFVTQKMEAERSPETSAFSYVMFNDVSTQNLIVLRKVTDIQTFIRELSWINTSNSYSINIEWVNLRHWNITAGSSKLCDTSISKKSNIHMMLRRVIATIVAVEEQ